MGAGGEKHIVVYVDSFRGTTDRTDSNRRSSPVAHFGSTLIAGYGSSICPVLLLLCAYLYYVYVAVTCSLASPPLILDSGTSINGTLARSLQPGIYVWIYKVRVQCTEAMRATAPELFQHADYVNTGPASAA